MKHLVIFASGNGTNAENIIRYFKGSDLATVDLVLCNKVGAGVIAKANDLGVPVKVFSRSDMLDEVSFLSLFPERCPDLIILAGFLLKIPDYLIHKFPERIINIHPALLPKFGGKGMYGSNVHKAVIEAGEKESGITIHKVNEKYDEGEIVAQFSCNILPDDNADRLASKIHELEQKHFPEVIEKILKNL